MGRILLQAAMLTLAVIAITQAASYAVWGGNDEYDFAIVLAGALIPSVTCFPISTILLLQQRKLAGALRELERAHRHLKELSSRDPMTGLLNRQAFFERVAGCAGRKGAYLMIDVDHFKSINDTHGHGAGDEALRRIATAIAGLVEPADLVARFGGEEFCVHTPGADAMAGMKLAERIRRGVGKVAFAPRGQRHRLTVSIGVANAGDFEDIDATLHAADTALYEAKGRGRNRVVVVALTAQSPSERKIA